MPNPSKAASSFWYVNEKDLETTPSSLYHEHSKIGEFRASFGADPKKSREMLALINEVAGRGKRYEHRPRHPIERSPWADVSAPLGPLLEARRTRREFSGSAIPRQALADLLLFGAGVNGELRPEEGRPRALRTYPSGGALFPLEIYPAVIQVDGLPEGLYHLDVFGPALSQLRDEPCLEPLRQAYFADPMVDGCAAVLLITAVFPRSRFKYAERAYRFVLLEAGHLAQNLILAGQALGLQVVPMGGFLDRRLEALLGVDGVEESVVYTLLVGAPGRQEPLP